MVATRLQTVDEATVRPAPALAEQAPVASLPGRDVDLVLFAAILALLTIGTIEIYASTSVAASEHYHDGAYFLKRQLVWLGLGGVAMWVGTTFDYRRLRRWTYPLLLLSVVLLAGALAMPAINGAHRWILLGPLSFQPVEVAKLGLISYLAYSLAKKADRVKTFTVGFVPHLVVCGFVAALLLAEPDLGSSIIVGATTLGMLFVAGARVSYIVLAVLSAAPIGYQLIIGTPWRLQRFMAYFNPEAFATREAYQFHQAQIALGSGGFSGLGLGDGRQALGYMPEGHNDFILAPIGEEMGYVGVAIVLVLFVVLVWRGLRAALGARDTYGGYVAFGITIMFAMQALFNVGVVLGVVPNKGLTLPFVSYGGTSLIMTMFLAGLVLNVGRRPEHTAPARELINRAKSKRQRVRVIVAR
ncbi:MAG TPA: putative lipid II flippase FtsW [Kofleriaceae bacterium]|nr:putative lipid II flippase FtsW [Kofleriaceae bacterium]